MIKIISASDLLLEVGHGGGGMEGRGAEDVGGVHPGAALQQQPGHAQRGEEVAHGAAVLEEVLSLE